LTTRGANDVLRIRRHCDPIMKETSDGETS
jgi:hypothetical protein